VERPHEAVRLEDAAPDEEEHRGFERGGEEAEALGDGGRLEAGVAQDLKRERERES
jgi:hypothetical protein